MTQFNTEDFLQYKKDGLKQREIAEKFGISEAELIAKQQDNEKIILLTNDWLKLINFIKKLGNVKTVTRNKTAVIEEKGSYEKADWGPHAATVISDKLDLRIFHKAWHSAFLIHTAEHSRYLYSIQIFDHFGDAIHKIYLDKDSNYSILENLPDEIQDNNREFITANLKEKTAVVLQTPENFNRSSFINDWRNLKDTHDFFPMIMKNRIHRLQALKEADTDLAWQLELSFVDTLLKEMSVQQIPIMIFVGNKGMIEIYSGTINNIKEYADWINIMDKEIHFHLNRSQIKEVWAVRKPTEDGDVHSIEVYDDENELAVSFFGIRKPGIPEREDWQKFVKSTAISEKELI